MKMERGGDEFVGDERLRDRQFDGESSILSSALFLDHVGEVVLSVNSTGLSWKPVDCPCDDESCWHRKLTFTSTAKVNFSDIYAVELTDLGLIHQSILPKADCCFLHSDSEMYRFIVHGFQRSKTQPSMWMLAMYTFGHKDLQICELFVNQINAYLSKETGRPKSLLVFVHPLSGKRNGRRIWEGVGPIFSRARVRTKVIVTERTGHAFDVMGSMTNQDLNSYDGVVAVGGDGFFNEILNGLLLSRLKAPYPPVPPDFTDSLENELGNSVPNLNETAAGTSYECEDQSPLLPTSGHNQSGFSNFKIKKSDCSSGEQDSELCISNERFRFGIIPAGSTDAIVICTTGVRDPITSALHIVLGKRVSLDIAQVVKWKATSSSKNEPDVRYTASFVGYGFYGDVIVESEKYRWMGPKRYDFAGTKVFLRHRSYEAEISYLEAKREQNISDSEKDQQHGRAGDCNELENYDLGICRANCQTCRASSGCTTTGSRPATFYSNPGKSRWLRSRGHFLSVGAAVISCRNERAPDGLVANAHLSDGFLHLVLIKECPHALYLRHLIELTRKGGKPLDFGFIEHHKTAAFAFTSFGKEGVWNLDGELLRAHKLSAQVLRGLVSLFATGPEV
ncbi:hypothetical protein Nepgr_010607 [Nepenthes gracilis]|uniref:DAGKc domain-containing protein n=1 Tax=Nepenthes gracilis TaxID=150966 RepID=A0AAD3SCZ8_NEPGR|nr:hypothetical protein Nepgr_010607 [Nepenthes gracilis]